MHWRLMDTQFNKEESENFKNMLENIFFPVATPTSKFS